MATEKTRTENALTLTRTFAAPREDVFRAWTEPEALKEWFAPSEAFSIPIAEVDVRVGGQYRIGMKPPEGDDLNEETRDMHTEGWSGCLDRLPKIL